MVALLVLLVLTNVATLGVAGWLVLRPTAPQVDAVVGSALDGAPAPAGVRGQRRVITIEILNPIELAGTRGRVAGIAGSLLPAITKRFVYEQALRQIRRDLKDQHVLADVRVHTIRPVAAPAVVRPARSAAAVPAAAESVPVYYDEIRRLDLEDEAAGY